MKTVKLPSGEQAPAFGLGTWRMGEDRRRRAAEVEALRAGLDLGIRLIDTAEMYGEGEAEKLVAAALAGRREDVFLVSKVYPHNATRQGTIAACERSLGRLQTDRLDLYLLHWRGDVPLAETLEAFTALQQAGKIRYWGVSNLDCADMEELWQTPGGERAAVNQLLYNLTRRGIEADLLPWLRARGIPVMAYSPIEQGRLLRDRRLVRFAWELGVTPAQAALAWLLARDDMIVIPKSADPVRVRENLGALEVHLTPAQLDRLDRLFPPPDGPRPLEVL